MVAKIKNWWYGNAPMEVRKAAYQSLKQDWWWTKIGVRAVLFSIFPGFAMMVVADGIIISRGNLSFFLTLLLLMLNLGLIVIGLTILHVRTIYHCKNHQSPWCWSCGYRLTGLPSKAIYCPECGQSIEHCIATAKKSEPIEKRLQWGTGDFVFYFISASLGLACLLYLYIFNTLDFLIFTCVFALVGLIFIFRIYLRNNSLASPVAESSE